MFNVWTKIKELINRPYIVESGSNTNGSYTKWSNGDMICTLNIKVKDQAISSQYANTALYFGIRTWTFPVAFSEPPVISCGCFRWLTGGSWGASGPSSKTEVMLFGYDLFPRAMGENCWIQAIAVGKWK